MGCTGTTLPWYLVAGMSRSSLARRRQNKDTRAGPTVERQRVCEQPSPRPHPPQLASSDAALARVYSWRAVLVQNLFLPLSAWHWETRCCECPGPLATWLLVPASTYPASAIETSRCRRDPHRHRECGGRSAGQPVSGYPMLGVAASRVSVSCRVIEHRDEGAHVSL